MKKLLFVLLVICLSFTTNVLAEEFSADMTTAMSGMTTSSKIYYRNFTTTRTETMGMIIITNGDNSYQLFDSTKKYVVMDMEEYKQQNPMADADDFKEFIQKNDMKKVGSETVGGYKCDVYEGNITYDETQSPLAIKFWYSPKLDYTVKTETQMPAPMSGTAVSTLVNINTGKQPDSLFEIPAAYTQAQSVEDAMGMGGFSMPSGGGESDGMPSQEEMEQMMQKMQEMMGGQNQ